MEDLKAMARAKRASSKRGKARHSHHKHVLAVAPASGDFAGAAVAVRQQNAHEEGLPSNWQRYSDGGGSEDEGAAPPVDGLVRLKSKGADYSQLLSSDAPKLYEDLPEPEAMFSMMLEDERGAWNGDLWLEPPSASEQQAAHDAASLLSLDLGLLGRSLAGLHVAERLIMEMELFPKQEAMKEDVETSDHAARSLTFRTENRLQEDKEDDLWKAHSSSEIENHEVTASSRRDNEGVTWTDDTGFGADAARSPVYDSPMKSPRNISGFKGAAPVARNNMLEHASRADERTKFETSAQPPGYRKFVPAAAEADLDELLGLVDNHVDLPPLNSSNLRNGTESTFSPDLPFLSNPSKGGLQFLRKDSPPRETIKTPAFGGGNIYMAHMAPTVTNSDRSEQNMASSKEVNNNIALSVDDDFDSWIDSI